MSTPDKTSDVFARSMIRVRARIMFRFRVRVKQTSEYTPRKTSEGLHKPVSTLDKTNNLFVRVRVRVRFRVKHTCDLLLERQATCWKPFVCSYLGDGHITGWFNEYEYIFSLYIIEKRTKSVLGFILYHPDVMCWDVL